MGYRRDKTYVLAFADEEFAGLEVRARGASINQVMGLMDLVRLSDLKDVTTITAEDRRELDRLFRLFVGCPKACDWEHEDQGGNHYVSKIRSWNLEDEGVPVTPDYAGYMGMDMEFQMALVFGWLEAVVGTGGGDLGKDSDSGGPPGAGSIPMDALPDDPPN